MNIQIDVDSHEWYVFYLMSQFTTIHHNIWKFSVLSRLSYSITIDTTYIQFYLSY